MTATEAVSAMIKAACADALREVMDWSPKRLMSVQECSTYLALSDREIHNMISNGELSGVKHGRRVMVERKDADAWVERNRIR